MNSMIGKRRFESADVAAEAVVSMILPSVLGFLCAEHYTPAEVLDVLPKIGARFQKAVVEDTMKHAHEAAKMNQDLRTFVGYAVFDSK